MYQAHYPARTDTKIYIISEAPWFRIPYPGKRRTTWLIMAYFYFRAMGHAQI